MSCGYKQHAGTDGTQNCHFLNPEVGRSNAAVCLTKPVTSQTYHTKMLLDV